MANGLTPRWFEVTIETGTKFILDAIEEADKVKSVIKDGNIDVVPLYTAPQKKEWVGLTFEEIAEVYKQDALMFKPLEFARAIEAKLKEKNGG